MNSVARAKSELAARQMANQVRGLAAEVCRVGLTETLNAAEGEPFHDALLRVIDERIAAQRWYRRVWVWVQSFPLMMRMPTVRVPKEPPPEVAP